MSISPTQEIIDELRAGRMVILVDDEDRENEGDLMIAADFVTPGSHQLHGQIRAWSGLPDTKQGAGVINWALPRWLVTTAAHITRHSLLRSRLLKE